MGRYSTEVSNNQTSPQTPNTFAKYDTAGALQYNNAIGNAQQRSESQFSLVNWPKTFLKPVIGLERDGTILQYNGEVISSPSQVIPIQSSLEAIRMMKLKGYKVVILTNQDGISKGLLTQNEVDNVHNHMMSVFGEAGIFSIEGLLYSTTNMKEDLFAKPNTGMFDKAKKDFKVDWKKGWYVGDKISDLKAGFKAGAKPILVKTGQGISTLEKLNTFANRQLKAQTKIYENLLEFAENLS